MQVVRQQSSIELKAAVYDRLAEIEGHNAIIAKLNREIREITPIIAQAIEEEQKEEVRKVLEEARQRDIALTKEKELADKDSLLEKAIEQKEQVNA